MGKTYRNGYSRHDGKKHPHMRGEDNPGTGPKGRWVETPPHAWGRQKKRHGAEPAFRNTPTCVGKTWQEKRATVFREKHPHMRGEDKSQTSRLIPFVETPPHAWGRQWSASSRNILFGNTPTCVGKTVPSPTCLPALWKHPHMRGEDHARRPEAGALPETPPHAWGRLKPEQRCPSASGNTPTCVGKTLNDH